MKPIRWHPLEHKLWKNRQRWPKFNNVLLALSGGVDSVVTLSVIHRLSHVGKFNLIAAHIHHGRHENSEFRDEASRLCDRLCKELNIPFHFVMADHHGLSSEESLRDFRYQHLRRLRTELQCDFIITAHHEDDLLETRMIRLLRGTGLSGLTAIKEIDGDLWRPMLTISKREISEYAESNQLTYLNDPTNESSDPLRNWVRNGLLPFIEARQVSFRGSLSRSLQSIAEAGDTSIQCQIWAKNDELCIERQQYLFLSNFEQKNLVVQLLRKLNIHDYSHGQIEEIHKRLDNPQKEHSFGLGRALWKIDARHVYVGLNPQKV